MDNPLQTLAPPKYEFRIFEHPQFGVIRILIINGEIWFVAADVCRALDLSNPTMTLERLEEDEKKTLSLSEMTLNSAEVHSGKRGGARFLNIINEPGFYRLVFASRKEEAREFQRWVYHEVLPAIRKYGSYSLMPSAAPVVAKPEKNQNRVNGQFTDACVYVAHKIGDFNIVKIGQSHDPENRVSQIKDMDRDDIYQMPLMPRAIARALEASFHNRYAPFKLEGEFFCANFYEVRDFMRSFEKPFAKLKLVSETAVRKAITDLKAFMNDPSIKKIAAPPTK